MPRKPSDGADRQSINVRTRTDLKQRLEQIAESNGRSLAQEVERRLERSLEENPHQKLGDPLPGILSDEVRVALRGSPAFAHLIEAISDTVLHTIVTAKRRERDEIEVRTAIRAALNAVADQYLWRGESYGTPVEPPLAALGVHPIDYPPAHLGHEIAQRRLTWLSMWHEQDASSDRDRGQIRNIYSGDGRTILVGPSDDDEDARLSTARIEAKAALARGDVQFEDPDRLHLYKPTRADPPVADEGDAPPPRSLKDIMGR